MLTKARNESQDLLIVSYLNLRMNLPAQDTQNLIKLNKGYEGEVKFDELTNNLQCECMILHDLLLKFNNTMFQIETIIITSETIYLFEVKNYEGDFYYESDRLYMLSKTEVMNPLTQLKRTESLLRQLLKNLGLNFPISGWVVFINPEFTLYQAPQNIPFIFPTQLNRFFKQLNVNPVKLERKHKILAEKLIALHHSVSPYKQLPSYHYEQLKKGIPCMECQSFSIAVEGQRCICQECGFEETVSDSVMRNVKEFKLLFPNEKITTNIIYDWCKVVTSKKRIKRILEKEF